MFFDIFFSIMLIGCIIFYMFSTFQVIIETWEQERYLAILGIISMVIVLIAVGYLAMVAFPFN